EGPHRLAILYGGEADRDRAATVGLVRLADDDVPHARIVEGGVERLQRGRRLGHEHAHGRVARYRHVLRGEALRRRVRRLGRAHAGVVANAVVEDDVLRSQGSALRRTAPRSTTTPRRRTSRWS